MVLSAKIPRQKSENHESRGSEHFLGIPPAFRTEYIVCFIKFRSDALSFTFCFGPLFVFLLKDSVLDDESQKVLSPFTIFVFVFVCVLFFVNIRILTISVSFFFRKGLTGPAPSIGLYHFNALIGNGSRQFAGMSTSI